MTTVLVLLTLWLFAAIWLALHDDQLATDLNAPDQAERHSANLARPGTPFVATTELGRAGRVLLPADVGLMSRRLTLPPTPGSGRPRASSPGYPPPGVPDPRPVAPDRPAAVGGSIST